MNLEKSLFKKVRNTIAAVAMSSIFFGCPQPTSPQKPETKPEIAQNVTVLSSSNSQKISSVDENSIYLSQPEAHLYADKIIVSGITPSTPSGLLRKVIGISSDGKTLYTEQASLEEVVSNYSFDYSVQLSPSSSIKSNIMKKGISRDLNLTHFEYNFDNVTLVDFDGIKETKEDDIIANGSISFTSNIDYQFSIRNFKMERLTFTNNTLDKITLSVSSPQEFFNVDKHIIIAEESFAPFVAAYIPTTPPIPIILTPKIEVALDINGNSSSLITTTVQQDAMLTLGFEYRGGRWSPIKGGINNVNLTTLQIPETINASITANQKLSLWLYDSITGIYAKANEYLSFLSSKVNNELNWQVNGGLLGNAGIDMGILSSIIPSYSSRIFWEDKLLASGGSSGENNTIPFANFFVSPYEGTINTEFKFDASTSKDDEDSLSNLLFRWDWNDDGTFDTDWSSDYTAYNKYSIPKQYGITLQVKDSKGLTNEMTTWIRVNSQ